MLNYNSASARRCAAVPLAPTRGHPGAGDGRAPGLSWASPGLTIPLGGIRASSATKSCLLSPSQAQASGQSQRLVAGGDRGRAPGVPGIAA
jgi:hypothetical protein